MVPPHKQPEMEHALRGYSAGTLPWAKAAAWRMIAEVDRRNLTAWHKHTAEMSVGMRRLIASAPVGETMHGCWPSRWT